MLHAACLLLLRDATVPVHCLPGADVGGPAFYFEQRYFLHSAQISDQLSFRKNEKSRQILERIAASYQLDVARDFLRSDDEPLLETQVVFEISNTQTTLASVLFIDKIGFELIRAAAPRVQSRSEFRSA